MPRRPLRRRETPGALARQMLRKIELLRRAYAAYIEHFRGANAALLEHLDGPSGGGGGGATPESERLVALKKDYLAWLAYLRTGKLPKQVFSAGIDLPPVERDKYEWLPHLMPADRQSFLAALPGYREHQRLRRSPDKRDAWLARDDGSGARRELYQLMHHDYKTVQKLSGVGRAAMKAAAPPKLRPASAARPRATAKQKTKSRPARARQRREWLQYLSDEERARADAVLPSYNVYNHYKNNPAERDAWLAAEGEEGLRRRAAFKRFYEAYKEHLDLYYRAQSNMAAEHREEQGVTDGQAPSVLGKTRH
jgi:hypothetical protein